MKKVILTAMAILIAGSFTACKTTRKDTAAKTPEVPKAEAKAPEAKKVDAPKAEVKAPEAKKVEAPKAEVKAPEAKKVEAPKAEVKAPEVKKVEAAKPAEVPAAKAEEPKQEFPAKYIVRTGDSLWKISSKFYGRGTGWKQIYEANKANISRENFLEPGTELVIPAPAK